MTLNNIININNYPKLDLHGLEQEAALFYLKQFINEAIILKYEIIIIVHGRGEGILRRVTHQYLFSDRRIIDYKTLYFNVGCTIVRLKL